MSAITTRLATVADAREAVVVVRRSISELCAADHQHDEPTLERWLRNKTPEKFREWCTDPDNRLVVAELDSAIAGVALLHRSGEVRLFYVHPDRIRAGAGRALLRALEAHAREWNIATLTLDSSLTARNFYERCGFATAGDPKPHFGVLCCYPYSKRLAEDLRSKLERIERAVRWTILENASFEEVIASLGLNNNRDLYREIDRDTAQAYLTGIFYADQAYSHPEMSQTEAVKLSEDFLAEFPSAECQYYSNGTGAASAGNADVLRLKSWNSVGSTTFEWGVVVVAPQRAGCVWAEDED